MLYRYDNDECPEKEVNKVARTFPLPVTFAQKARSADVEQSQIVHLDYSFLSARMGRIQEEGHQHEKTHSEPSAKTELIDVKERALEMIEDVIDRELFAVLP